MSTFSYFLWETTVEKVRLAIYKHEMKGTVEESTFWNVADYIFEARGTRALFG